MMKLNGCAQSVHFGSKGTKALRHAGTKETRGILHFVPSCLLPSCLLVHNHLVVAILMLFAPVAMAATWTVTTADFAQRDGELAALGPESVELRQPIAQRVPWREIVSIEQTGVAPIDQRPFVLTSRDGQRLSGKPLKLAEDKLQWESQTLGTVQFPLEELRSIARAGASLPAGGNEDVVILQNGDVIRGVIDGDPAGLAVQRGADRITVKWDSLSAMLLAQVGETVPEAPGSLKLRLSDGSVCLAAHVQMEGDRLRLRRRKGDELSVPLTAIIAIENQAGRAQFLSTLRPSGQQYTPYIRSATAVQGIHLADDEQIRNVIELRPRSSISYAAPADGILHLRYACAAPGPLTDMTLVISSGQRTLLKEEGIRSADPSKPVELPVEKGETITILVDYGRNYDVQDNLRLLEAAFVGK